MNDKGQKPVVSKAANTFSCRTIHRLLYKMNSDRQDALNA